MRLRTLISLAPRPIGFLHADPAGPDASGAWRPHHLDQLFHPRKTRLRFLPALRVFGGCASSLCRAVDPPAETRRRFHPGFQSFPANERGLSSSVRVASRNKTQSTGKCNVGFERRRIHKINPPSHPVPLIQRAADHPARKSPPISWPSARIEQCRERCNSLWRARAPGPARPPDKTTDYRGLACQGAAKAPIIPCSSVARSCSAVPAGCGN